MKPTLPNSLTPRRGIILLLALAAVWLGHRWLAGGDPPTADPSADSRVRVFQPSNRMVFRDGRWVRVGPEELQALLRDLASRKPGLVRVSGTVRDTHSRQPVPDAEVVFASEDGESSVLSDADGAYTLEIRPGFYRAFARADGYVAIGVAPPERLPTTPDATRVGVPRAELAPLIGVFRDQSGVDMHLRGGAVITGTVYDTAGRPIPGAVISGQLAGYYQSRIRLVVGSDMDESDLDGSFRLEVPAGPVVLDAVHDDYAGLDESSPRQVVLAAGDSQRIDLTMTAGCIITGRVVDGRGEPVGEGSLETANGLPPPNDYYPVGKLDATGSFRLARTTAETLRLRAWPWKSPPTVPREFPCSDGTRYDDVVFVTPDADPELEGVVLSASGEPVADAYLDLFPLDPGGMAQQERADIYGDWAFYALPSGDYQVTAYVPGHGTAAQTVTVPSRGVRLVLSGTGAISGTVNGMENGSFTFAIEHCVARTQDGSAARFDEYSMPRGTRIVAVESGTFHIDDLPACPLRAVIRTPARTEHVAVDIEASRTARLSIDLRPARRKTVFGVVTDSDRVPVSGVHVTRMPGAGTPLDEYTYAITDGDGRYELEVYTGDTLLFRSERGWAEATVGWDDEDRQRIDSTLE